MKNFQTYIFIFLIFTIQHSLVAQWAQTNERNGGTVNSNQSFNKSDHITYENISHKSSYKIFDFNNSYQGNDNMKTQNVNFVPLKLLKRNYDKMYLEKKDNILIRVPSKNGLEQTLELKKVNIFTNDFKVIYSDGKVESGEVGQHYQGSIVGNSESKVAISFFNNLIYGIIYTKTEKFILSKEFINLPENSSYLFFNVNDLNINESFSCFTPEHTNDLTSFLKDTKNNYNSALNRPVRIYFEADYSMKRYYDSLGPGPAVFLSALFNSNISPSYENILVPIQISTIFVWTSNDPYLAYNDPTQILKAFGNLRQDNFNGDLGHLVSHRNSSGGAFGVAWPNVLCTNYNPGTQVGRFGLSFGIRATSWIGFPIWFWDCGVICHELGHNFGSPHTHNCSWPGGPIDSCYATEGGCYTGPVVPRIGTIMSYCNLTVPGGGGINNLYFGALPGTLIRNKYNSAACLLGSLGNLNESFEPSSLFPPLGWTLLNPTGGEGWRPGYLGVQIPGWQQIGYITTPPGGGQTCAFVNYSQFPNGNDQWLITPRLINIEQNDSLKFWLRKWPSNWADTLQIKISTTLPNVSSFNINVSTIGFPIGFSDDWHLFVLGIGNLVPAGSNIYIAFREIVKDNISNGATFSLDLVQVTAEMTVNVNENNFLISDNYLLQNYPNPFNPRTKIKFNLAKMGMVNLKVYNILGIEVKTLVQEILSSGNYEFEFLGEEFPSGLYFYKLESEDFIEVKKMMLIK